MNSPWWDEVSDGNSGRGLPSSAKQTVQLVTNASGTYWVSETSKE